MTSVNLLVVPSAGPGDLSAVDQLNDHGARLDDVLAIVGKTEGNGCVNDFSRELASNLWEDRLSEDAITVFSGGTEGVLAPHLNIFVRDPEPVPGHDRGLVIGVGQTRPLAVPEIGRPTQIQLVAQVVSEILTDLEVTADDVHLVLVKCPLLSSAQIAQAFSAGDTPVCTDTYQSMAHSRAASALGIAVALRETTQDVAEVALTGEDQVWSARASTSAGAELRSCHIMVLAVSRTAANPLRAMHGVMHDAIDLTSLHPMFSAIEEQGGTVRQVFVKAEADPSGAVRGLRHTMLTDSDINATRHARAAVGGLVAALKGDGAVYVSGGAEHQGPPGGGSITIVYEIPGSVTDA